jgi:hypothetical protein
MLQSANKIAPTGNAIVEATLGMPPDGAAAHQVAAERIAILLQSFLHRADRIHHPASGTWQLHDACEVAR